MIMMPIHNGFSLLRNHGPDCVLLPLVRLHANGRTSYSFELLLLQSSPVVEISSLLNFIHISFAKLFFM